MYDEALWTVICKELDKDNYLAEKAKVYAAKERLEKAEAELDASRRRHEEFEAMHMVLRKKLPLTEILDCIDSIVVSEGRKIEVKCGKCADLQQGESLI